MLISKRKQSVNCIRIFFFRLVTSKESTVLTSHEQEKNYSGESPPAYQILTCPERLLTSAMTITSRFNSIGKWY